MTRSLLISRGLCSLAIAGAGFVGLLFLPPKIAFTALVFLAGVGVGCIGLAALLFFLGLNGGPEEAEADHA